MQLYSLLSFNISAFVAILSIFAIRWIWRNSLLSKKYYQLYRLNRNYIKYPAFLATISLIIVYSSGLLITLKLGGFNDLTSIQINQMFQILGGGLIFCLLGIIEDALRLRLILRLFLQAIAVLLWLQISDLPAANFLIGMQIVKLFPFLEVQPIQNLLSSEVFSTLTFIIWLVIMTNAFKWMNRSHNVGTGISAISTLVVMLTSLFIAIKTSDQNIIFTIATISSLAGITVGLLLKNSGSNIVALSNGGAYFIGFILAGSGVIGLIKTITTVSVFLPYLFFVFPGIGISRKTLRELGRDMFQKRSLWITDQVYLNDRMKRMGASQHWSILYINALVLIIGGIALIFVSRQQDNTSGQIVGIVYGSMGMILIGYTIGKIRKRLGSA